LAKLSLLGVLATFLAVFVGIPRATPARRIVFAALVVFAVLLAAFSLGALRSTGGTAGRLAHHLPLLGVAGLGLVVFLAAATWLAWRYPEWAMPTVLVLAPLRVGLPLGSSSSNLLIPLYLILLAVALAEMVVRDRLRLPEGWRPDPVRVALAIMIAVVGVSSLWAGQSYAPHSKAFADALVKLFAFFLPFGVLYFVLYRYAGDVARLSRLLITFVAAGAAMAVIGIVQYPTHVAIVNRAGAAHEHALGLPFRASSLFWDPNMFGRFLALVMLVGAALFLTARLRDPGDGRRRAQGRPPAAHGQAPIAFVVTLSRSSVAGLLLGALVLEMAWLGRRKGGIAALVTVVVLVVGLVGVTELRHTPHLPAKLATIRRINKLTGGRYYLVQTGVRMFERHPVAGIGLGGFPLAFPHYRTTHAAVLSLTDSHTTVVTVAAEQGLIGLAAFAFLLVTFFATTLRKRRFGADRRLYLWQASLVACVVAVLVHSLTYNAFFEDPYMWVFMALASAAVTRIVFTSPLAMLPSAAPADGGWSPHAAAKAATRRRDAETAGSR
jgi:O-antigen ligase